MHQADFASLQSGCSATLLGAGSGWRSLGSGALDPLASDEVVAARVAQRVYDPSAWIMVVGEWINRNR